MEPIRIALTNFLSFKEEIVELEGITCAALTGENGAGKSSLLDAITWALFGQGTRGKDLDNYVTRGESECHVELQFMLNENLYRVDRGRSRQRAKSMLEFFVQDGSEWRALSAKAITDTQALIEQTLRMDYRTFTASSLILQGQADSFTANLTDAERKEVLGSILGLDMWDKMQEATRAKARDVKASLQASEAQKMRFHSVVDQGAGLADRKAELTGEVLKAERDAIKLACDVTDIEVKLSQRPALEKGLVETSQSAQKAREERSIVQDRQTQIHQQIGQCESQIIGCQAILTRKAEIEEAVSSETGKAAAVAELDRKAVKHTQLIEESAMIERQKAVLDADKATRIAKLETELQAINRREQIEQQIDQYKSQIEMAQETLQLKDEVEEALVVQSNLMIEIGEHERKEQDHTRLSREAERLSVLSMQHESKRDANIAQLEATVKMYQSQLDVLGEVPCSTDQQSVCPLLANARQATEQMTIFTDRLAAWQVDENPHEGDRKSIAEQIKALGYCPDAHRVAKMALVECQKTTSLKPRLDAAEQRADELENQIADLEIELAGLADRERIINEQLAEVRAYENPFGKRYDQAQAEKAALGYDPHLHRIAKEDLVETQKVTQLKPQLDAAERRVNELNGRINELQQGLAGWAEREAWLVKQLAELEAKEQSVSSELAALAPLTSALAEKRQALENARLGEAALRTELGRIEQQLTAVAEAEAELAKIETETKELRQRLNVLEALDQACGKKAGVPALIVENAVPELERLANEMLSRMAGGRLQVRLDTQAETKSGTMQEVLRIIVLEAGVERPYQTYSGAERFLVDLALRVALSKFLSHRAGAEIRLFVLDEGIGCADATNRQAILDAILAVSDEFGKTLVVTHLEELKEAFPQRIEVTKDESGSKVRVA